MTMDPGINGLETYRRILELHPRQKAIIASGHSETELVHAAQKIGAGQYLKKTLQYGAHRNGGQNGIGKTRPQMSLNLFDWIIIVVYLAGMV